MASPGMYKRLNPQTGQYEYSQVTQDGQTKFFNSLQELEQANPNFDDAGDIQEIPYNPSAPHPPNGGSGIPINTSIPTQTSINDNPVITGDYATDLAAYRKANPSQDSMAWLQALAPEQKAWMAANPGKGDNPVNPNSADPTSPYYVPSPTGGRQWSADPYSGAGLSFNLSGMSGNTAATQAKLQQMIAAQGGVTGQVNNSGSDPIIAAVSRSLLSGLSPDQVLQSMQGQFNPYTMPSLQQIQQVAAGMTQAGFKLDGSMAPAQTALAQHMQAKQAAAQANQTPGQAATDPAGTPSSAWDSQLRQTYMDSPTYNPNGANTWGIQNSPISSLNNAFGGQIGGNGQPTPGNLAQAQNSGNPQPATQQQMPSMGTPTGTAPIADSGQNGSSSFNSNTAFGGATSGWKPPSPTPTAPAGPTWGAQTPIQGTSPTDQFHAKGGGGNPFLKDTIMADPTGPYGSAGNTSGYAGRDLLLNEGTSQFTDADDPRLHDALAEAQKMDPTAYINTTSSGGGTTYSISSKKNPYGFGLGEGQTLAQTPDEQAAWNQYQVGLNDGGGILHNVKDPSKVTQDDNYGSVTSQDNIEDKYIPEKKTALDIYGPMLPLLFAGGMGAFADIGSIGSAAIKGGLGAFSNLMEGNGFNPGSLALQAAGAALPGFNLDPSVATALKYLPIAASALAHPAQTAINTAANYGMSKLMPYITGGN